MDVATPCRSYPSRPRLAWAVLSSVVGLVFALPADSASMPGPSDVVVLGRLYHRTASGTQPVARLGLDARGAQSTTHVDVPADPVAGLPAYGFSASARTKGHGARITWELTATAGGRLAGAKGVLDVVHGSMGHVDVERVGDVLVFASFEVTQRGDVDAARVQEHFGQAMTPPAVALPATPAPMPSPAAPPAPPVAAVPTVASVPSAPSVVTAPAMPSAPNTASAPPMPSGGGVARVAPAGAPLAPARPVPPAGGSLTVSCASGSVFLLSTGSGTGNCAITQDADGRVTGGSCDDGRGNAAAASCVIDGGHGSCTSSRGTGACAVLR